MTRDRDDKFSMFVPDEDVEVRLPERLEVVETVQGGKPKTKLQGGAYDPYHKLEVGPAGDTARIRKPRVDLRKLSEWIKTTQRVQALREEDLAAAARAEAQAGRKTGR